MKHAPDCNSSDEELLRAAEALEKVTTLSDEEWMEAVIELENEQVEQENCHTPDRMLSLRMTNIHLDRNQGQKGGSVGQEEQEENEQGACHHAQEEGILIINVSLSTYPAQQISKKLKLALNSI